jgi:hypothetical protein
MTHSRHVMSFSSCRPARKRKKESVEQEVTLARDRKPRYKNYTLLSVKPEEELSEVAQTNQAAPGRFVFFTDSTMTKNAPGLFAETAIMQNIVARGSNRTAQRRSSSSARRNSPQLRTETFWHSASATWWHNAVVQRSSGPQSCYSFQFHRAETRGVGGGCRESREEVSSLADALPLSAYSSPDEMCSSR